MYKSIIRVMYQILYEHIEILLRLDKIRSKAGRKIFTIPLYDYHFNVLAFVCEQKKTAFRRRTDKVQGFG